MDVTIIQQPELRIAGIRHIGPYHEIGRAFGRLGGMFKVPPPAGAQMVALFHDDPAVTAADQLRSDAAITLIGHASAPAGLIEQRIPAGRYAKTIHRGGYEGLPAAWNALKKDWLPNSGHRMGAPSYEVYLNNPMTTEKADLLTEIYLRLA
jgi:AraC family transcriptional regulator